MAYLSKHGVDKPEARQKAIKSLPVVTAEELKGIPPALSEARKMFRGIIATRAERAAGGTNLNRDLQRREAAMRDRMRGLGLALADVRFPEEDTKIGRDAKDAISFGHNPKPREWASFAGERAIYAEGGAIAKELGPLEPWQAPDDSPASRARLARRDVIAMSIENEWERANGWSSDRNVQIGDAIDREAAALGEIGLRPHDIRYPEDARAQGFAAIQKREAAVSWEAASRLGEGGRFVARDGRLEAAGPAKGLDALVEGARGVLKEADARRAIRAEDEMDAWKRPKGYDAADRTHEERQPSLAVRAAMALGLGAGRG